MEVVAPSGDLVHVVIPDGHGPGSLLLVQVHGMRDESSPENLLMSPLNERHALEQWEMRLQKLVKGYTVDKVARNGRLYQRQFWLAGGSLRTNGRFSSGVDLKEVIGIFRGAVSQEFIRLRTQAAKPPRKSGSGLLRMSFGGSSPDPVQHADPDEAGVVLIATGSRSFSLLFRRGAAERDEFAETVAWGVQRILRERGQKR